MLYLILFLLPLLGIIFFGVFNRRYHFVSLISALILILNALLLLFIPTDLPFQIFALGFTLTPLTQLFLLVFFLLTSLICFVNWQLREDAKIIPLLFVLAWLTAFALVIEDPFVASFTFILSSL